MSTTISELPNSKNTSKITAAWEEFVDTGKISSQSPRSVISESWKKSRQSGINPHSERAKTVIDTDELEYNLNKADLGVAGKNVLDKLSTLVEGTKHIIVLANASGQIMYSVGHEGVQSELENINFMPGGDWSADQVGPNGVGTPIALGRPELVFGTEHYCQAWQPWVCYGAPVHNSAGNVIGGVDITGPAQALNVESLSLAASVAHSIEAGLSLIDWQRRETLRTIYRTKKQSLRSNSLFLVDNMGFILDADEVISRLFQFDESTMWVTSLSNTNISLWKLFEACIHNNEANNFVLQNDSQTGDVRLIIEPIEKNGEVLGATAIVDQAIQGTTYLDTKNAVQQPWDLRTQKDQLIRDTLKRTNGNISKAARILGINRITIYRHLNRLNH